MAAPHIEGAVPGTVATAAAMPAPARNEPGPFTALVLAVDRRLTALALHVACALLAVISALGLWQVIARFVLSQPSSWTEEVMRRLLVWCVVLGTVVAFRRGALVSVDLMLRLSLIHI